MDYVGIHRRLSIMWMRMHDETYPRIGDEGAFAFLPEPEYSEKAARLNRVIVLTERVENRLRGRYAAGTFALNGSIERDNDGQIIIYTGVYEGEQA